MSSHKEAPGIANDAAADNTDVYVFVSPDKPDTVTLIANFVPLQNPAGGPNFYEFGEDVLYEIHIDNNGDAKPDVTYQFRFTTRVGDENTFLYNTGPIESIDSANWNRKQFYTVTKVVAGVATPLTPNNLACPPCNIGPASTPNYSKLAQAANHTLNTGEVVFAGQRAEGFYVDLGAIFDLGILRPFLADFLIKMPSAPGINSTKAVNINTIAIQVPKTDIVLPDADTTDTSDPKNTIGVYSSASRQRSVRYNTDGTKTASGAFVQISRLANPLFNEVLIPIPKKDGWNADDPADDKQYASHVTKPELAGLLPVLYPGVFPHLAKYKKARVDLEAILLTGIPAGVVSASFQNVGDGKTLADLIRLNTAIKPTTKKPSNLGLLGGDLAGFPNGRRVFDDTTTIELRAIAGVTIPLVDPSYKPDAAAGAITPGLTSSNTDVTAENTVHYMDTFPYLGVPHSGYSNPGNNDPAPDLGAINQPPKVSPIPVGPPNTGIGPAPAGSSSDHAVLTGVALAGLAVVGGVAARSRMAAVGTPAPTRRPQPHRDETSAGPDEQSSGNVGE